LIGVNLSRKAVESLALLHRLGERASLDKLTEQSGHTLSRQTSLNAGRTALGHISAGVQHIRLEVGKDSLLVASVLHLLGGRLPLGGVLAVEQVKLMLDELDEGRIGCNLIDSQQGIEVVTLGRFTGSVSHSIDLFLFFIFKSFPTLNYIFIIPHSVVFVKRVFEEFLDSL
jgi:hypothetical protein